MELGNVITVWGVPASAASSGYLAHRSSSDEIGGGRLSAAGEMIEPVDAGAAVDAPAIPPEVGTPARDMHPHDAGSTGDCVVCSDGQWHCNGAVLGVCPVGIQEGAACNWTPPTDDGAGVCLTPCPHGPGLVAWACCYPNEPCPIDSLSMAQVTPSWRGHLAGSDPCE